METTPLSIGVPDGTTDEILVTVTESIRTSLKPFIGTRVSSEVVDQIREIVLATIDSAAEKSPSIRAAGWEKWVTVKQSPLNRNHILIQLNDPYNAPAWLYRIFYAFSGHEAI